MAKNNYLNVLLVSGSGVIGGLINYAYHPIMLHYLTLEEFGTFGSLVGMFNILGIITVGFVLFLNKEISKNIENKSKIKYIFWESLKLFSYIGILVYICYLLFSGLIANFLNIKEISLIWIVGIAIIFGFLGISENATLRGLKKFEFMALLGIIAPAFKLLFGFLLVFLGFKVFGAIIGFILGGVFTFVISLGYLFKYFKSIKQEGKLSDLLNDFSKNKIEIINFFFINVFFAILMNIDVILAKNIFDEKTAGIYAGLSVLGKFLIFLLLSIETVYYGQIMEHKKEKLPFYLIKNPLIIITITSILALIINYFIGSFVLSILKKDLVEYTNIYLLTLVYYSLTAFISFFIKILIGWKKYYINYIMGILTLLLIFIIYSFGINSLKDFIYSFIIVGIIGTLITGTIFFKEYNNNNN